MLFRREKLHERLARLGGVDARLEEAIDLRPPWPTGIHGIARPRDWDTVIPLDAPDLRGDSLQFVVLQDGTILEEDVPGEQDLSGLADVVEEDVHPPYRAHAVRRYGTVWVVGARRLRLVEVPNAPGDEITLAMRDGAHELMVGHLREFGSIPALEAVGAGRDSFVVEAKRLDDDLFEYRLTPL